MKIKNIIIVILILISVQNVNAQLMDSAWAKFYHNLNNTKQSPYSSDSYDNLNRTYTSSYIYSSPVIYSNGSVKQ